MCDMIAPYYLHRAIQMSQTKDQINADIAIKNNLYVEGWGLILQLERIRNGRRKGVVRIHYEKTVLMKDGKYQSYDIPVAVLLIVKQPCAPKQAMVFVKEEYRRKGIATKMLARFKPDNLFARTGVKGSHDFWSRMNIKVYN
jgi:GNAT superfamily N-acetyltransferase